ncbi:AAA family ATPase [Ideonella sp. DXS22W]|uniref:AAA family ATPase n=1 Tax=Pseudaquabacterium inlustre TaxID=2984192 RepID=A0ABU9CMT3_9BURK
MTVLPDPARLRAHLDRLNQGLLERETAVRLALLAALAGEHVLLIGPPGTAKSELARRLHRAFDGARYFERLLTRFSTPEELFGPLSLQALEADRYERLVDGYLPTAGIAFLDEVFKANSAILNALLTLLNERQFDNGAQRLAVPLVSVIGASNEPPADESLQAFHDRFLLRVPVAPVSDAGFAALLQLDAAPADEAAPPPPITTDERAAVRAAAARVTLGDEALAALAALRTQAAALSLPVSDRRWRQLLGLMRCAAATEGRDTLDAIDLWLAPYAVAHDADSVPRLQQWVDDALLRLPPPADAQDGPLPWLGHAVTAFEKQLELEQRMPAEGEDDAAGKLALARSLGGQDGGEGMHRIVSATLEARLARRWSPVHVAARVAQVDELQAQVQAAQAELQAAHDGLAARLAGRLWLPPGLAARWLGRHGAHLQALAGYAARLAATRAGFAAQPQDAGLPATPPEPVDLTPAPALA